MATTELDELREQLKRGGFLRRYLEETGRQIISGGQLRCPNPSAHANGDKKPSAHLYEDSTGDRVKCFGCGGSWDIFSLVQLDEGLDFMGALESLAKRFGLKFPKLKSRPQKKAATSEKQTRSKPEANPKQNLKPQTVETADRNLDGPQGTDEGRPAEAQKYLEECAARIGKTDYFEKRGISLETASRLGCGFDPAHYFPSIHKRRPGVIFPAERGWAARATTEKSHSFLRGMNGGSAFNLDALDIPNEPEAAVFIVEGQFDALSIEEAGGHAVALGGVQHFAEIVERVRRKTPQVPLVVALDFEANAQKRATIKKAEDKLKAALREAGAFVADIDEANPFGAHDANDALLADREKFAGDVKRLAWQASEAFMRRDDPATTDGDGKNGEKKPGYWAQRTTSFAALPEPVPEEQNPRALFKRGYLRKGHALCLVSCAGVGKSVISLQLALAWSIGKACFGIEPVRPLRIAVFTFEDDTEDNADFRRDYREGFRREGWTEEEIDRALASVEFIDLGGKTDEAFAEALADIQRENPRDLYIVNPLGDIMDEFDASDNAEAKHFFKRVLDPVLKGARDARTECALVLVGHTGKAPKSAKDREGFMRGTFAQYDAAGAAALMNWARAILMIAPTSSPGDFILLGAKRQARLGWKDADGKATNERFISYSPDIKFWIPTPEERVRKLVEDSKGSSRPAADPAQDAASVAQTLRSLTSGISATEARRKAQEQLGQARGNAAFAKIAARPGAFNVAYEKIGRVEYYGGTALGLGAGDEPPPVEGLGDFPEEPYGLDDPAI